MPAQPAQVPAQVLVTSGRFRDNRRGMVRVDPLAGDLIEIVIEQAGNPYQDVAESTTRIVLSGEHLDALYRAMGKARSENRKALRAVESVA